MRAQIQSQVVVYILAVVITTLVLAFGYRAIVDMQNTAQQTQEIMFLNELSKEIKSIGQDYGTSKVKTFNAPAKYRQVCFVNLEHTDANGANDVIDAINSLQASAIIKDSVKDYFNTNMALARKNMFLCPPCTVQEDVGNITLLDPNGADTVLRCFNTTQGSLRLSIAGLGDRAQIS